MEDTVVGLFQTRSEADAALGKLKALGVSDDEISVSTPRRRRRGYYGLKLQAGLIIGVLVGALAGALFGALPGTRGLLHGTFWLALVMAIAAGTVTGGVAGALLSMAASGDRALYYEQQVESGRYLVTVSGPRIEQARQLMSEMGAMETAPVEAPIEHGRPRPESG